MNRETRISIALVVFVGLSLGLLSWVGSCAEGVFGGPSHSRFPEKTLFYSVDMLRDLVTSKIRMQYAFPILFPFDLAVMLSLSASTAAASWYWLHQQYPKAARIALWASGLYLASDLIEDCLLAWLLLAANPDLAASMICVLKVVTFAKFATITCALLMTAIALVTWLRRPRPAS